MSFWDRLCIYATRGLAKRTVVLAALLLVLTGALSGEDIQCTWSGVEKIVAVADVHGDYDNFERILRGVGLIDAQLNWIGGKTHFVQLGDVMDRGGGARQIFDLLRKLEKQAIEAGGMVHVLIGNHEEANIIPIAFDSPGYVTGEQMRSFLPDAYRNRKEEEIRKKHANNDHADGPLEAAIMEFWEEEVLANRPGEETSRLEYAEFFFDNYGKWLLTKNVAVKINDIVFVHGGFNEAAAKMDLQQLNNEMRAEIEAFSRAYREYLRTGKASQLSRLDNNYVTQPMAPYWFRGLVQSSEKDYADVLTRTLENLDARYMVVGHTVREEEFIQERKLDRFDGRVWAIDVGISFKYRNLLCALIYENGRFEPWWGNQ